MSRVEDLKVDADVYLEVFLMLLYLGWFSLTNISPAARWLPPFFAFTTSGCVSSFFPCFCFVFQRLKSDNEKL